jgi:hypothetical protein
MVAGQCLTVLVERSAGHPLWQNFRINRPLAITLPLTLAVLPLAVYTPGLNMALHFAPLGAAQWGLALGVAVATTLWYEPIKAFR